MWLITAEIKAVNHLPLEQTCRKTYFSEDEMAMFSFIRGEKISNPTSALVITGFEEDIDRH